MLDDLCECRMMAVNAEVGERASRACATCHPAYLDTCERDGPRQQQAAMCFQGFLHHHCGCTRMYEEACDLAKDLDLPIWSKVACVNYNITRRYSPADCGTGSLYCASSPDAAYLDHIQGAKAALESKIADEERFVHDRIHPLREQAMRAIEHQHPGDMAMIKRVYTNSPACRDLDLKWDESMQRQRLLGARLAQANRTLHYAREFYILQRHTYGTVAGNQQPLPEVLKNLHAALESQAQPLPGSQVAMPLQPPAPPVPHAIPQQSQNAPARNSALLQQLPKPLRSLKQPDPFGPSPPLNEGKQSQPQPSAPTPPSQSSSRKRRRAVNKATDQATTVTDDNPDETSPNLRRSTRVRGKKISYAEEASDDLPSATPSPEKSDASVYSPTKSDISHRVGVKTSRSRGSLRDMIGEYQKQAAGQTATTTPTRVPSPMSQSSGQMPGMFDSVPHIKVDSPRSNTPDTDILHPEDPRHDGGMQIPMKSFQPPAPLVPRTTVGGNPDPALLAFQVAYQKTHGSGSPTKQKLGPLTVEQLKATVAQRDAALPTNNRTSPTKRQVPASSSPLGSCNEPQLSYPWTGNNSQQTMNASSPPRMTSSVQPHDTGMLPVGTQHIAIPPPAPSQAPMFKSNHLTFKPSGLSQVSPMQDTFAANPSFPHAGSSMLPASFASAADGDTGAVMGEEDMSDPDWSLFSDGGKF